MESFWILWKVLSTRFAKWKVFAHQSLVLAIAFYVCGLSKTIHCLEGGWVKPRKGQTVKKYESYTTLPLISGLGLVSTCLEACLFDNTTYFL